MFIRGGFVEGDASEEVCDSWIRRRAPDGFEPAEGLDDCAESLRRTIEAEVIPRLMLAHLLPSNEPCAGAWIAAEVGPDDVVALADLVLADDAAASAAFVQARRGAGLAVEALYLQLLAPAAERLGALWESDQCDFTQVTVGLWRLQQLVHEYSPAFQRDRRVRAPVRRALLVPAPGSQHTFGIVMVGEFFRRAGWDVRGDPGARAPEVSRILASEWIDVLGLSVGSECHVEAVASAILELRKVSLNPAVLVMVGGPIVASIPDFVGRTGADGTAPDAASAVLEAERLVAQRVATG